MMDTSKPFLTARQFHRELHGCIGLEEVYNRLRAGNIHAIRVGKSGHWRIPASELEDWPKRISARGEQ